MTRGVPRKSKFFVRFLGNASRHIAFFQNCFFFPGFFFLGGRVRRVAWRAGGADFRWFGGLLGAPPSPPLWLWAPLGADFAHFVCFSNCFGVLVGAAPSPPLCLGVEGCSWGSNRFILKSRWQTNKPNTHTKPKNANKQPKHEHENKEMTSNRKQLARQPPLLGDNAPYGAESTYYLAFFPNVCLSARNTTTNCSPSVLYSRRASIFKPQCFTKREVFEQYK